LVAPFAIGRAHPDRVVVIPSDFHPDRAACAAIRDGYITVLDRDASVLVAASRRPLTP
jgi:hypothetical protein